MKRGLLTAMGMAALALAMPGAALAHHGHGHHGRHGNRAHAHHATFRMVHIGAVTTGPPTAPATGPTPPAPENAGTVTSYTNGVLTLTLNDKSTVSGKVTSETRIECVKATPPAPLSSEPGAEGPGDDNGQGDDQSRGDMSQQQGDQGQGEWQHGDEGDDDGGPVVGEPEPPCDSSSLVPGAVVRAAELRVGPGGTEFESLLLVR